MAGINKILDKVNSATNAFKSLKGVQSKIEGFRKQASSTVDQLESQAAEAERTLEKRRLSLQKNLKSSNVATRFAKMSPETSTRELQYPIHDEVENVIVFSIRPRKSQNSNNGRNLMSQETTEIQLYVPDGIVTSASVSYKAEGVGQAIRSFAEDDNTKDEGMLDNLKDGFDAVSGIAKTAMNQLMNAVSGGYSDFAQGRAVNPMEEQMLDGVQFRGFTFQYEFYPRSPQEAAMVNQIIYTFRTAMLPDTFGADEDTSVENYFNYPNIFDVEYEGPVAKTLDGFLPMVCTKCDVDHFGGQKVAVFNDGQPLKTTMTLEFLEIKILTQETYQKISPIGREVKFTDSEGKTGKFVNDEFGGGQQSLLDNMNRRDGGEG